MAEGTVLTIHTDGAARGNPGPAAFAFVIARDGESLVEDAGRLGEATNNQAEYTALVRALEHAVRLGTHHRLVIHSDSELMVRQMKGEYRVKDSGLRTLYERASRLCDRFDQPPSFVHVRREQNRRADELCNEVLDGTFTPSAVRPEEVGAPQAPAAAPSLRGSQTFHERAVAYLTFVAGVWTRGQAKHPTPEAAWKQLWEILEDQGVTAPRPE